MSATIQERSIVSPVVIDVDEIRPNIFEFLNEAMKKGEQETRHSSFSVADFWKMTESEDFLVGKVPEFSVRNLTNERLVLNIVEACRDQNNSDIDNLNPLVNKRDR